MNRHHHQPDPGLRALLELPGPILSGYLGRRLPAGDDPPARRHAVTALLAALGASEEQTIRALAQGRVRTLLAADVPDRSRVAWFGAAPTDIAVHRTELPAADLPPCRGPLIDVAVRAAILTDADIRILPAGTPGAPASGIAAICRF